MFEVRSKEKFIEDLKRCAYLHIATRANGSPAVSIDDTKELGGYVRGVADTVDLVLHLLDEMEGGD